MVKAEIIDKVHSKTGVPKTVISEIFEAITEEIMSTVASRENIVIRGFGTFKPKKVSARKGRDFEGNEIKIPEKVVPSFTPSDSFSKKMEDEADVQN